MVELWGGIECTVARIGDRWCDQTVSTGHQDRIADLDAFASLGIRAIRYPVLWERVAPDDPQQCDWRWSDERLARLQALGIRPIVGLVHHGAGPRYTNLADPGFAQGVGRFAARVAARYPWVRDWTPINEPLTTARFSGLYGHWHPHGREPRVFLRLLMNELDAVRQAMRAIRREVPDARLVQTDDLGQIWSTPPLQYQADFENERRWLGWDLLCGHVDRDHPLWPWLLAQGIGGRELDGWLADPCPPDIIGVNHYLSSERFLDHRIEVYDVAHRGGNGRDAYADVEAHRVVVDGVAGAKDLLRQTWERYRLPIAVTEVHNGCTRDEQMRWFVEVWDAAVALNAEGVDLRAVTAWSLLGAVDWNSLLTRDRGFYEPGVYDTRAPSPRPTAMAGLLRDLARTGRSDHPVLDTPGWWQRHDRLHYPPVRCRPLHHAPPPAVHTGRHRRLLIIGARGTLGQALARACVARALPHVLLGRDRLDIADDTMIAHAIDEIRPWAVINAAGMVDVDGAERDPERCWRDNVLGPGRLAHACATAGVPLVTFSSDLVFDGRKHDAYLEPDAPAPLSAYGRSKAAAERAVLGVHESALVIRTSAFFSPWDPYNFAWGTLARLRMGEPVAAVRGVFVSPTYVPDLADQTLDLLIDGERGIWHLASGGALDWHGFACAVADAWGFDTDLVREASPQTVGWLAERPRNAALASMRGQVMPSFESAFDRFVGAMRAIGERPAGALGLPADPVPSRTLAD